MIISTWWYPIIWSTKSQTDNNLSTDRFFNSSRLFINSALMGCASNCYERWIHCEFLIPVFPRLIMWCGGLSTRMDIESEQEWMTYGIISIILLNQFQGWRLRPAVCPIKTIIGDFGVGRLRDPEIIGAITFPATLHRPHNSSELVSSGTFEVIIKVI